MINRNKIIIAFELEDKSKETMNNSTKLLRNINCQNANFHIFKCKYI